MRTLISILILTGFTQTAWAIGGDNIREEAPVTALLMDLRDGHSEPLLRAYRENEIDYFLDFQLPSNAVIQEMSALRAVGRLIANGDTVSAQNRLSSISQLKNEREYLSAVIQAAQGQYEQSLDGFRKLIDKRDDLSSRLSALAFIGAARVFHEVGDYKQALYHYTKIRPLQSEFFQSIFEKAWSFYLDGDMNGALGTTLAFLSPYADKEFYPEALIVRAAAFFQLCYFERASSTIEFLKRKYEPIRMEMESLLAQGGTQWVFDSGASRKVSPAIIAGLIMDPSFRSAMRAYQALNNEKRSLSGANLNWNQRAIAVVKQRLERDVPRVLSKMIYDLKNIIAQADVIQIEILQTGANVLLGVIPDDKPSVKILDLGEVDFDELVQFWAIPRGILDRRARFSLLRP